MSGGKRPVASSPARALLPVALALALALLGAPVLLLATPAGAALTSVASIGGVRSVVEGKSRPKA